LQLPVISRSVRVSPVTFALRNGTPFCAAFTAIENDQDLIITRNLPDFKESKIPVMTTDEFIKSLKNHSSTQPE
jgi:hypothetical protein